MSQRRSALGRGLGALISNPNDRSGEPASSRRASTQGAAAARAPAADPDRLTPESVDTIKGQTGEATPSSGAQELDIGQIDPNPEQPRRAFEREALEQLSKSIGQHGVLQPVVVRRAGDRYELIMGERRFRASQLAGRKTIPAVIAEVDPAERLELAIVENVQRRDLNPMELAHAYQALADAGHTQDEIGRKVSMNRSSVANHLRLLDLSRTIQADVEVGNLSMGHAKALLQVQDPVAREALRTQIQKQGLSVRAAEKLAREGVGTPAKAKEPQSATPRAGALDADTRAYVERIERHLQTKVNLQPNADGSGKIEIRYFNLEDLERLGAMLLGDEA